MSVGERKDQVLRLEESSATGGEIEPLLTAAEVGRLLAISTKRVYEVVGHLAVQLAPHTLRWRLSDIAALIEERRRNK
jgi:predicted DNA-binding transcriptional regulator AlpA